MRRPLSLLLLWALACAGCAKAASRSSAPDGVGGSTASSGSAHGGSSSSSGGSSGSGSSSGGSGAAEGWDDPRRGADLALYTALTSELPNLGPADREARLDRFLADVAQAGGAPLRHGGDTVFIYRGSGPAAVNGDFNNKWLDPPLALSKVLGTTLWAVEVQLGATERHQYKLVVNGAYFEDPLDPWVQWDGSDVGATGTFNSLLVGPQHPPDDGATRHERFHSTVEGNTRDVYVYLARQYLANPTARFGALYQQDGNAAVTRGHLDVAAQASFDDGTARTAVLVFVDLDDPSQRQAEYTMVADPAYPDVHPRGALYAQLLADELVPYVDGRYRTVQSPLARAVSGQGLGGLSAFYVGYSRPDAFGALGSQSGTLGWAGDAMISTIQNGQVVPVRCYLDSGATDDAQPAAVLMDQALSARGYAHLRVEEPGGGQDWSSYDARFPKLTAFLFPPAP